MLTNSLFWFVLSAAIGGAFVTVGLVMEQMAEKSLFKNIEQLRRCKKIKVCGEVFVIAGVFVETVVAGITAASEWGNRPVNQPVSTVEAIAQLSLTSSQWLEARPAFMDGTDLELTGTNIHMATPLFYLIPHGFPQQFSINGYRAGETNSIGLTIEFNQGEAIPHFLDLSKNTIDVPAPTVKEALDEVKAMVFYVDYIPKNSRILGGKTILKINGFTKEFTVPEQAMETNFGIVFAPNWQPQNMGLFFFATNEP